MAADLEVLEQVEIFRDLTEGELAEIGAIVKEESYPRDGLIFFEGEVGRGLFFIKTGQVKVSRLGQDGKEHILHIFGPGDVFGEVMLFDDGLCPATALALVPTTVGIIEKQAMEDLVAKHPHVALKIIGLLTRRLRLLQEKVRSLALLDTAGRVAGYLWRLAKEQGERVPQGIEVEMPVTHAELAALVGSTRETANRVLRQFRAEGIIDFHRRRLLIKDEERLCSWYEA